MPTSASTSTRRSASAKATTPVRTGRTARATPAAAKPGKAQPAANTKIQPSPQTAGHAKAAAIAKAKRTAPHVAARIGSTPKTKFRGNADLFGRLVEDHDRHRALLAMIAATQGNSQDRQALFKELVYELKSHAAAEEQALWSTVLRNPDTTDDARHAISEHKEIDDLLADLAARDMGSSGWIRRFVHLHEEYLHHIKEEEQEQFVAAQKHLSASDVRYMKQVFNRRKQAEKASVTIEKKLRRKS